MRIVIPAVLSVCLATVLSACSPTIGTEAWCKALKEKPAGDWSANDTANFGRHCLLKH